MIKKLYVGNLSFNTDQEGLRTLFSEAGAVADSVVITDRETGQSKGFGFVEMADEDGAKTAVERFDGSQLDGRSIKVAEAKPRENRDSGGGSRGGGNSYGGGGNRRSW
ncbi:MAG: RNA-binding protein [Anaerolineae bacterium]|jgi:RNA recognition motif-containing protein